MQDFQMLRAREQSAGDNPLLLRPGHKACFTFYSQALEGWGIVFPKQQGWKDSY